MNSKSNLSKLGVKKSHRDSLKKNLVTDFIIYEHLKTTKAKAVALIHLFDRAVNVSTSDLPKNEIERKLQIIIGNELAVKKMIEVISKRFKTQKSGFANLFALQRRKGDAAEMVKIIMKGYVYKEVGKKLNKTTKEEAKAEKAAEAKANKPEFKDSKGKSQVAGNLSTITVKSRKGI
jgi:ribosomal protein L17